MREVFRFLSMVACFLVTLQLAGAADVVVQGPSTPPKAGLNEVSKTYRISKDVLMDNSALKINLGTNPSGSLVLAALNSYGCVNDFSVGCQGLDDTTTCGNDPLTGQPIPCAISRMMERIEWSDPDLDDTCWDDEIARDQLTKTCRIMLNVWDGEGMGFCSDGSGQCSLQSDCPNSSCVAGSVVINFERGKNAVSATCQDGSTVRFKNCAEPTPAARQRYDRRARRQERDWGSIVSELDEWIKAHPRPSDK